jgi:hypothetical protein
MAALLRANAETATTAATVQTAKSANRGRFTFG